MKFWLTLESGTIQLVWADSYEEAVNYAVEKYGEHRVRSVKPA